MMVTVTAGTNPCNHITVRNQATNEVLMVSTLAELLAQARDGDPLLLQMRYVVKAAGATTKAQAKTAIEAADFV